MSSRAVLLLVALGLLPACGVKAPGPVELGLEICDNKKDDNGDGKVDCADPKCFKNSKCTGVSEVCDNGVDDNGNGLIDCLDPMCEGQACGTGCVCVMSVKSEGDCADHLDNDGDGLVDCSDPDCAPFPACSDGGSGGGSGAGGGSGGSGGGSGAGGGSGGSGGGGTGGSGAGGGSGGSGGAGGGAGAGAGGGGGGGAASGGGGGAGGGGTAGGGGAAATETNCADNIDNDNDGKTDCDDPDCIGRSCGMGCQCVLGRKTEINCGDGADNDNDGKIDCLDSDCVGVGTENCTDGIDNTCDRAIDCGDTKCAGNAACTNQSDGKGCTADSQCAGGKCYTEAASGAPNGACANSVSCNATAQTGCNGGTCMPNGGFNLCRPKCTGNGLGANGCRPGYACYDPDSNTGNNNNGCIALCSADSECAGSGTGYGCNPFSKHCELKDNGLGRYGANCTSGSQCESGICDTSIYAPGGYCFGLCRGDSASCGTDGICEYDSSWGDNIGYCNDACGTASLSSTNCSTNRYQCRTRGSITYCACGQYNEFCVSDSQCCSNSCDTNYFLCN